MPISIEFMVEKYILVRGIVLTVLTEFEIPARRQLLGRFSQRTHEFLKLKRQPPPLRFSPNSRTICATVHLLFQEMRRKWVDAQMAEWGVSRARSCGWWDGYTFSKAIAEMLVHAACSFLLVFLLMLKHRKNMYVSGIFGHACLNHLKQSWTDVSLFLLMRILLLIFVDELS